MSVNGIFSVTETGNLNMEKSLEPSVILTGSVGNRKASHNNQLSDGCLWTINWQKNLML